MADNKQYHSEVIDLPSLGKVYPKDSPISNGKIEIKYMTAKEEDILTSQNLIKKGLVIDKLLDSLIVTEGIKCDDLVLGDKNAVMVAARVLAYGPEYEAEVTNPNTEKTFSHVFNLADCPFKKIPDDVQGNKFETTVTKELATHTEKLDNIQMQLNSIDRNFVHYIDRQNKTDSTVAFMKGVVMLLGSVLTIFIALVAYLK